VKGQVLGWVSVAHRTWRLERQMDLFLGLRGPVSYTWDGACEASNTEERR
jgi:hypothetical protein